MYIVKFLTENKTKGDPGGGPTLLVYLCMNPNVKETKGYRNYTKSLGGKPQS